MRTRVIYVGAEDNECPADALLTDFRRIISEVKYAKNIEFSKSCIDFFRDHADIVEETEDNIHFRWDEIPEEELPPLEVKIRVKDGRFALQYLIEHGEEPTQIKGKAGKGKNRESNEKIIIVKREAKTKSEEEELSL